MLGGSLEMRSRTLHLLAADRCQPPHARVLVNLGFRLCECLCECLLLCPFRLQLCLASLRFRRFGLTLGCLCRGCLANRLECLFLRGAGLLQRCDLGLERMCSRDLRMQSLLLRLQLATQRRGVGLERLCSRDLRLQSLLLRLHLDPERRGVGLLDVVEFARHRGASIFGIFQLAAELLDVRILHNLLLDILVLRGDLRARWRLVRRRLQLLLCVPLGLVLLAMSTVHRSRSVKTRGAVCAFQDLLGRL
mmetsp:Transcript_102321/g.293567  ORF Transcript_102321/g.293567 Transcript_102321/m.293567 type:complete len:249 (-) Transcript_102321:26-772(-)